MRENTIEEEEEEEEELVKVLFNSVQFGSVRQKKRFYKNSKIKNIKE